MRRNNFVYYCFLVVVGITVVSMFASIFKDCSNLKKSKKRKKVEFQNEISCRHPAGHVIKYKVSGDSARYPLNMKGSMWYFKTIEGKHIISTFCHTEID